jgi:hypothetical protein
MEKPSFWEFVRISLCKYDEQGQQFPYMIDKDICFRIDH